LNVNEGSAALATPVATAAKHILLFGMLIDLTDIVKHVGKYGTEDAAFRSNSGKIGRIRVEINNKRKLKWCIYS
jgi:hypothetical protein